MNVRELHEESFANFADHAGQMMDKFGNVAKAAFSKLKDAKKEADSKVQDAARQAIKKVEHEKAESEKQKAEKKEQEKSLTIDKLPEKLAQIIVTRDPIDPKSIEELYELSPEQLKKVYPQIKMFRTKLTRTTSALRKLLTNSSFLQATHKSPAYMMELTGDQPDQFVQGAINLLNKNEVKEQQVWNSVLLSDDPMKSANEILDLIKAISLDAQEKNKSLPPDQNLATGTKLVKRAAATRQAIERRLANLSKTLETIPAQPVKENLRTLQTLLERV